MLSQMAGFVPFYGLNNIPVCVYHLLAIHLMMDASTLFLSGCTNFQFPQEYTGFLFLHALPQYLLLAIFLTLVILTGMRCYLIMALICICLMIGDVEHLFVYCWPSVCFLWQNVNSGPLHTLT